MSSLSLEQARKRYAAWEKSAPLTLSVLAAVALVSCALFPPGWAFVLLNISAGLLTFVSWRCALKGATTSALVSAMFALSCAGMAVASELVRSMPLLLGQGLSLWGLALFAGILFCRASPQIGNRN